MTLTNQFRVRGQIPLDSVRVCVSSLSSNTPELLIRFGARGAGAVRPSDVFRTSSSS